MVWWKCLKCTHKKPLHSMDCGMQQWPVVPVKHDFLHEFTVLDPQPNQSISVSYYETSSSAVFVNISSAFIGRLIGSSEIPTIQGLLTFRNNSQPFSSFKIQDQCKKPNWKKQVSEMIPRQSLSKQQHYPAAIGLEWLVHIPSRCVQQCGIWSRVSWCSRHAPAAGWCSAPDTEDEARSRHGRMPAVPEWSPEHGSARLPPGRYARPGRPSTQGWCRPCSEVGPTTDAYHQHSAINKQVKAPVHK